MNKRTTVENKIKEGSAIIGFGLHPNFNYIF